MDLTNKFLDVLNMYVRKICRLFDYSVNY